MCGKLSCLKNSFFRCFAFCRLRTCVVAFPKIKWSFPESDHCIIYIVIDYIQTFILEKLYQSLFHICWLFFECNHEAFSGSKTKIICTFSMYVNMNHNLCICYIFFKRLIEGYLEIYF